MTVGHLFILILVGLFIIKYQEAPRRWGRHSGNYTPPPPSSASPSTQSSIPHHPVTITIMDSHNRIVGTVTRYSNRHILCGANGATLGVYYPESDTTVDSHNHIVAYGDALTSLLRV